MNRIMVADVEAGQKFVRETLAAEDLVCVTSFAEAVDTLRNAESIQGVIAGVHFDYSRMFDLLRYCKSQAPLAKMPFVCIRVMQTALSDAILESLEISTQLLGACAFVDVISYTDQDLARETLRKALVHCGNMLAHGEKTGHWRIGWATDTNGGVIAINPDWLGYTGLPAEESMGDGWLDAVHPDDRDGARAVLEEAMKHSQPFVNRFLLKSNLGIYDWFRVDGAPMLGPDGEIKFWSGTCMSDLGQAF